MRILPGGVFEHVFSYAAFLDRLAIAIRGTRRARPSSALLCKPSIAIGGPGRPYARSIHGTCMRTGNPFELRYGANPLFSNLPACNLRFRSEACPLTEEEVRLVTNSMFRSGVKARPTLAEMTWDLTGTSMKELRNSAVTSFRRELELRDEHGRSTYYAGGPRSGVQLRVYDKAAALVRVEMVFRSSCLRSHGILDIEGIGILRDVEISRWIRFCAMKSDRRLERKLKKVPHGWRRSNLLNWPLRWPLNIWASTVRHFGVDPKQYLRSSAVHEKLLAMQTRLVW